MKVGDLVKYRVVIDELTGTKESGTAIVYEKLNKQRYRIFTNRGDTIDISSVYMEVVSAGR